MTLTPVQLTEKVIDLIADPKHWTQRIYFRDKNGASTDMENAHCYCSSGALRKVQDDWVPSFSLSSFYGNTAEIVRTAFQRKAKELFPMHTYGQTGIITFNDSHTHNEVMAVWNETLKDLRIAEDMKVY